MRELSIWQEGNDGYLTTALAWINQRLELLAQKDASTTALTEVPISSLLEQVDPPPALIILGQRFGLSRFEIELLLLCAAPELDTRIPALYARAQGNPNSTHLTFSLAFTLFGPGGAQEHVAEGLLPGDQSRRA